MHQFKLILYTCLGLIGPLTLQAQENHPDTPAPQGQSSGEFDIHLRSFYMNTVNRGQLSNYSALAAGAGLGYQTPVWNGFRARLSGFFIFQLYEDNIKTIDPTTGSNNRYELALFDMHNPDNGRDLDRLEELYLEYRYKELKITMGRQGFDSPFLNEQFNRMRPNLFSGGALIWTPKKWEIQAAWFNAVSPRGTVNWYKLKDSFGVYPHGRNTNGTPSQYLGNMDTKGLGVMGIKHQSDHSKLQVWNYYSQNVFNLAFAQTDFQWGKENQKAVAGFQGFYQTALHNDPNLDTSLAYINPGERSFGYGARAGWKWRSNLLSLNFLTISDKGRLLFPREWGREHFYTSLSRERYEGNGGLQAYTLKYDFKTKVSGLTGILGAGIVNAPNKDAFALNKYGVPSYYHFQGLLDYRFKNKLKGLDLKMLVVNKTAKNERQLEDSYRINRVDMWNLSMIVDYRF